jgi:transposase
MRSAKPIELTEDERAYLQTWVHRGHATARIQTRARSLLQLAAGWRDVEIARTLGVGVGVGVGVGTVYNTRQRFLEGGLEVVLRDKAQERRRQALTGEQIAHLIAVACSPAPTGHDHWTLRRLAGKAVERGYVPSISPETVRQALKNTSASPGSMSRGVCPGTGPHSWRRWKRSSTATRHRPIRRPR